jgi:hypothetical protein
MSSKTERIAYHSTHFGGSLAKSMSTSGKKKKKKRKKRKKKGKRKHVDYHYALSMFSKMINSYEL